MHIDGRSSNDQLALRVVWGQLGLGNFESILSLKSCNQRGLVVIVEYFHVHTKGEFIRAVGRCYGVDGVFPCVGKCFNEELINMTASLVCVSQHLKKLMSSVNPPHPQR
jgi:hypothetical protein